MQILKDLNSLIHNHAEFLRQFGIESSRIRDEYELWQDKNPDKTINTYFGELLRQASLFIIKNADTEDEYYSKQLEIHLKTLEILEPAKSEARHYILRQIHFCRLMVFRSTVPVDFDVRIDSNNCCSYCNKRNKKTYSFERVLEKEFLPFVKCSRTNDCICSYSVVLRNV